MPPVTGDDDPVDVQEVVAAGREPDVVGTLIRLTRRDREEEGGDAPFLLDDAMVRGLGMQLRQRRLIERAGEQHGLLVQDEDRREVPGFGVPDQRGTTTVGRYGIRPAAATIRATRRTPRTPGSHATDPTPDMHDPRRLRPSVLTVRMGLNVTGARAALAPRRAGPPGT